MNEHTILTEIERLQDVTVAEKRLLREEQFLTSLWRVVSKISKNNIKMFANQVNILLNSLLRRYRRMVHLQAREVNSNKKLFLQLLKQKMKDNFRTLDHNLRKFQLRKDLRKPNRKSDQTPAKTTSRKSSNLSCKTKPKSASFRALWVSWKMANSTRKFSASSIRSWHRTKIRVSRRRFLGMSLWARL